MNQVSPWSTKSFSMHKNQAWVRGVMNCVGPPWCWGWGKGRFVGCLVGCPPKAWASHEPVALVGGGVAGSAPKPSTPGCSPSSSGGSLRLGQSLSGHKDRQANKKLEKNITLFTRRGEPWLAGKLYTLIIFWSPELETHFHGTGLCFTTDATKLGFLAFYTTHAECTR